MNLGTATVIQGNALQLPLPDASVDLICTSPPYFGLRSYQDGGVHYAGQIGSEATPAEFLDALLAATREMARVLKPSGSIFVNLGDKYASSGGHGAGATSQRATRAQYVEQIGRSDRNTSGIPTKSLIGIPWRYAIACIDELGLILRAEIIWSKPNGLPESVTDRVRRSHEQWFHFTLQPRYFAAVDEIREGYAPKSIANYAAGRGAATCVTGVHPSSDNGSQQGGIPEGWSGNPLGKLPGSVWTIPTQPLEVPPELGIDHFAAYPMEWPRRIIQGWTPQGICAACGQGRRPVGVAESYPTQGPNIAMKHNSDRKDGGGSSGRYATSRIITGYMCGCATPNAPTRPATVLDPFGGTGTTALVAKALGRTGISIDLSHDYTRLAEWRCNNPQQLATALQVEKPEVVPADQLALFDVSTNSQD